MPPTPSPPRTLKSLDELGQDVRAWCFRCGRGERFDAIIWQHFEERGWPVDLDAAAARFRCKGCRSADQVLLVAATRPPGKPTDWANVVAGFFHRQRSRRKRAISAGKARRP